MEARLIFRMKVGKRTYQLYVDCYANTTDVSVIKKKYVSVLCHQPSVDEKNSHKDYKKAFELSPDGDYHLLVEFKKNPNNIHVKGQYNTEFGFPKLVITIEGE